MRRIGLAGERVASKERSKVFMVVLGLFGIGVFVVFGLIGFTAPNAIPGRSYYYVYAKFHSADNITLHYQVRVDGDIVGQVVKTSVEDGVADVKMQINSGGGITPLKSDSVVQVLPRSAVGVRYIEITPGTHGTNLKSGATIPASQTSSTEPLDTVLGTLNAPARANTRKFLQSFGEGLAGRGQQLNDTLGISPKFLTSTNTVLQSILARSGDVSNFISGSAQMAAASNPVRQTIASGFQPEANALKPFSNSQSNIDKTFSAGPGALNTVHSQLPAFDGLATQMTGFANGIEPGLKAAPAAFRQTSALFVEAKPSLLTARQVLKITGQAVNPFLNFLKTTQPVLKPLRSGLGSADPIVSTLGAHGCDLITFGKNWTSMMQYGDSTTNVLRFAVTSSNLSSVYGATKPTTGNTADAYPAPCTAFGEGTS